MTTSANYTYNLMGQRFSDLEDVYNTLTAIDFDFNQLPATNKYRKYKEWKQVPNERKPRTAPPASGKKQNVGVMAFGLDSAGDANHTLVKMGSRAKAQYDAISGNAVFNLNVTDPVPATYVQRAGFIPAKAILGRSNGSGSQTSRATGLQYKQVVTGSYTIPFGAGSGAAAYEFGAQNAILATAGITNDYVVSFTPEKISRG